MRMTAFMGISGGFQNTLPALWLRRVAHAGIPFAKSPGERRLLLLANRIVLTLCGIVFAVAAGTLLWGQTTAALLDVAVGVIYLLSLLLARSGRLVLYRIAVLAWVNITLFVLSCVFGSEAKIEICFIPIVALPWILIGSESRWTRVAMTLLPLACSIALEALSFQLPFGLALPRLAVLFWYPWISQLAAFSVSFAIIYHFYDAAENAELRLRGLVRELREEQKLILAQQRKLVESSKMSALGEMAGGIAHEINNPLSAIQISAAQVKLCLSQDPIQVAEAIRASDRIQSVVQRISKIIRSLHVFAREGEGDPMQRTRVFKLIEETLEFCKGKFQSRGVRLILDEIPDSLEIECNPVQISQVLLNLLNNALDAVGGKPGAWVRLTVQEEGGLLKFSVADSGAGIPESIRHQILEPFFTTKAAGKGVGLGLSLSKQILERHQGSLYLDTESEHTRFVCELPGRRPVVSA